ncbi:MAG: YihA family ribosome biogenesis GTP-binding protein [Deltaproteobacteria bacterium]|jgi:GTP-binding protein|nr:YihA family ribosome biogenesis GTP-binding protein [Deltaproteobacteria bacterium]MBT6434042.1 YihA family ribosome biogenesis GTP-binding protein [Deltaproteobacteria bacterium]MBT6492522.1 YihA family ribosome biogenesis GTP-binding protein [Deltaproteobacteria bacterium]
MAPRFIASSPNFSKLPVLDLPEIAFAGRSNVGKSSLIGRLIGQASLVRTSRTPGRTQMLNLFQVDNRWAFVDLPGYGYAKLSKTQRKELQIMIADYLARRDTLRAVVLVLDARRTKVSDDDLTAVDWVAHHNRLLVPAITKSDLVPKNKRLNHVRQIEKQLQVQAGTAVVCSAKSGEGKRALYSRLIEVCGL